MINSNAIRYVYDCGSRQRSACEREVKLYLNGLPKKSIDLLFLSHFDDDHVNSVPELLDKANGTRAETVVLPLIDDVERIICLGRAAHRKMPMGDFFRSLIADPVAAISTYNPGRILLVRKGPSEPDDRGTIPLDPIDVDRGGAGPRLSVIYDDDLVTVGSRHATHQPLPTRPAVDTVSDDMLINVSAPGDTAWVFKPYIHKPDPARVTLFEATAEGLLKWPRNSFRKRISSLTRRRRLISNMRFINVIATAYQTAFRDRNLTSLSLYSGPPSKGASLKFIDCNAKTHRFAKKIGWLATGDTPLKTQQSSKDFLTHFLEQRDLVSTFALPHHGSIRNYSSDVIVTLHPMVCFACARPPRNWKHPHPDVIKDVRARGITTHVVDDANSFHEQFLAC